MAELGNVRMALVQFSFSNGNIVPPSLLKRERDIETPFEQKERKERHTGVAFIDPPVENVSIVDFLRDDLQDSGFELVDAFYQPRFNPKDRAGKRIYHMVRFVFVQSQHVTNLNKEFLAERDLLLGGLYAIVTEATWRVRGYMNPFFRNGQAVPGQRVLSVNLNARVPLLEDGKPKLVWKKGSNGERIGDAPVPLAPAFSLRAGENALHLIAIA